MGQIRTRPVEKKRKNPGNFLTFVRFNYLLQILVVILHDLTNLDENIQDREQAKR